MELFKVLSTLDSPVFQFLPVLATSLFLSKLMLHSQTFDLQIIFAFHRTWDRRPSRVDNSGPFPRFGYLVAILLAVVAFTIICHLQATGFGFLPNPNCSLVMQYVVSYWHITCCQCLCSFRVVSCHHPDLLHLVS